MILYLGSVIGVVMIVLSILMIVGSIPMTPITVVGMFLVITVAAVSPMVMRIRP